jgi:hypothetical protein
VGTASVTFLESLEGWSTVAVAVIGMLALGGTLLTLRQNRNVSKRTRSLDYVRRLFGLNFAQVHMQVLTYLSTADQSVFAPPHKIPGSSKPQTEADAERAYDALDLEQRTNVFLVFNFYEELSGSYTAGLLDCKITKKMLLPAVLEAWSDAAWFVEVARRRAKKNFEGMGFSEDIAGKTGKEVLSEWERLAEKVKADLRRPMSLREWLHGRGRGQKTRLTLLAAQDPRENEGLVASGGRRGEPGLEGERGPRRFAQLAGARRSTKRAGGFPLRR